MEGYRHAFIDLCGEVKRNHGGKLDLPGKLNRIYNLLTAIHDVHGQLNRLVAEIICLADL
jgi:hypothetical protein